MRLDEFHSALSEIATAEYSKVKLLESLKYSK